MGKIKVIFIKLSNAMTVKIGFLRVLAFLIEFDLDDFAPRKF